MSPRDELRREAGRLAREVRRYLEREQAAGNDEIWVQALGARRREADRAPRPGDKLAPPRRAAEAPWLAGGAALGRAASAAPAAAASEGLGVAKPRLTAPAPAAVASAPFAGSLFGDEPEAPAPQPSGFAVPVAVAELHPAGEEPRRAILEASLPVLEAIAAEVRACTRCGLCETRTQAVPGTGSARSGIVFVGEAPGAEEDRRGEPFVGRAGELLTRIIEAMERERLLPGVRLTRDTVYICNVLKCRPPENRNPLPHEIQCCAPYLHRQLEVLKPRIICCLGKFAAELLLGVKGAVGGLRGRVYPYRGSKLIVTYHPAACLRNPSYKRPIWDDMQFLAREYVHD